MKTYQTICLVGPMGAGKSTVGKHLADFLHLKFYDSDSEIEKQTGASISWIFEKEGEPGFRKREEKIIDQLARKKNIILATGGGAVISSKNRQVLMANTQVVYLKASVDILLKRTRKDRNRPLLQTSDPAKVIRELLQSREAFYCEVADLVVETKDASAKEMARNIIERLCISN